MTQQTTTHLKKVLNMFVRPALSAMFSGDVGTEGEELAETELEESEDEDTGDVTGGLMRGDGGGRDTDMSDPLKNVLE